MRICIVIPAVLPATRYGGTERVVVWLGKALRTLGHEVSYLARPGSRTDFAPVYPLDPARPLDEQMPPHIDIAHLHAELPMPTSVPACLTVHGNASAPKTFPANSIFVSRSHAENHGARVYVHNGLDPADYGGTDDSATDDARGAGPREAFAFLGNAAWSVKNVRGAIRVARRAGAPIDILGGTRVHFRMGFKWHFSPYARFHGMVDDSVKIPVLRRARGLIFPVRWPEPFGIAVIEAMHYGLPVFGTPYGALPELVPEFAGGLSDRAEVLGEAARRWAQFDPRAIRDWATRFTAERMARDYLGHYTAILDGQDLHSGPIVSPAVRGRSLLPWTD